MPRRNKDGKLSRKQLATEAENQLRENTRDVLTAFWAQVKRKLDTGDNKTMEMVGRMFQYDKGPGGVTIFNQHLQLNNNVSTEQIARVRSFDQIIGKLEEQENLARQNRLIAAPIENSEPDEDDDDEDIVDAETEDVELVGAE